MKKKLLILLSIMLLTPVALLARSADDIVSEFRDSKHAQYVNVGRGMLRLARIFTPEAADAARGITSIRVLDLSDCKDGVRNKFRKRVKDLRDDLSYEEMVTSNKDSEQSLVLMRSDGTYVSEIVVVQTSNTSDAIVVIRGNISLDDVERITRDGSYYPIQ